MIAGIGLGLSPASSVAAAGVGGVRGVQMVWSNGLANNNWHLIFCDGTNVVRDLDTGIEARNTHQVLEFQYGAIAGVPVIRGLIDGVVRATLLQDFGFTMAQIFGTFPAATMFPRFSAFKIQAGQNGNNVRFHHGGYIGHAGGRVS